MPTQSSENHSQNDKKQTVKKYIALNKEADTLEQEGDFTGAKVLRTQAQDIRKDFNSKMNTYVEEHYHEPKRKIQENLSKLKDITQEMSVINAGMESAYQGTREANTLHEKENSFTPHNTNHTRDNDVGTSNKKGLPLSHSKSNQPLVDSRKNKI